MASRQGLAKKRITEPVNHEFLCEEVWGQSSFEPKPTFSEQFQTSIYHLWIVL